MNFIKHPVYDKFASSADIKNATIVLNLETMTFLHAISDDIFVSNIKNTKTAIMKKEQFVKECLNGKKTAERKRACQIMRNSGSVKSIKRTSLQDGTVEIFKSKSQCAKSTGCSPALVYLICEKKNYSKTFKNLYKFEYV